MLEIFACGRASIQTKLREKTRRNKVFGNLEIRKIRGLVPT
jgi:hypothetical protein